MRLLLIALTLFCVQVSAQNGPLLTRTLYPKSEALLDFQTLLWSKVKDKNYSFQTYGNNKFFCEYVVTTNKKNMDELKKFCGTEAKREKFTPSEEAFVPLLRKVLQAEEKNVLSLEAFAMEYHESYISLWARPETLKELRQYVKTYTYTKASIKVNTKKAADAVDAKIREFGISHPFCRFDGKEDAYGNFLITEFIVRSTNANIDALKTIAEKYNRTPKG